MERRLFACCVVMLSYSLSSSAADDGVVRAIQGTVEVRHSVSEEWRTLQAGDTLRVEDTIRTGKNATARIMLDGKQIRIPEQTIIDISDFRLIGLEEFLLRLAMENILSLPAREEDDSVSIMPATEMQEAEDSPAAPGPAETEEGVMLLHGAKLLYEHAFYATSILQTKEAFRLYPELRSDIDARIRVAYSFESMLLMNEALTVYSGLLSEELSPLERSTVQRAIERIRDVQNRH